MGKSRKLWVLIIFLISFTYRLWGIRASGALWDEDAYFNAGFHYYYNLRYLQFDPEENWGWIYEHPPVGKYIYGVGTLLSYQFPDDAAFLPRLNFTFGRLESALMGSLTVILVLLMGWEFFSPSVGVLAASVLAFSPVFAAYSRIIGLESPQALFWTAGLYFFLKAVGQGGNNRQYLAAGLGAALAFATKYNSGLLLFLFGLIFCLGKRWPVNRDPPRFVPRNLLLIPVIVVGFLYLVYPWLWRDPWGQFWKSFTFSKQHVGFGDYQPWYYLRYLLATTPLVIVLLSLFSFRLIFLGHPRQRLVVTSFWLNILVACSLGLFGFKGAGVRYVIFAWPTLALLAGVGSFEILSFISQKLAWGVLSFRRALVASLLVTSAYLIWQAKLVHPYEVDYYSELVGGVGGALQRGLGVGFRGEGGLELISWANDHLPVGSRVRVAVAPQGNPSLSEDLLEVKSGELADYLICLHPCGEEIENNQSLKSVYTLLVAKEANLGDVYFDPTAAGKP